MNDVIRRLESEHPGLLHKLAEDLNPSDLQSLLLEVARRRSLKRTPSDVVRDFSESRFFAPAKSPVAHLLAWDNLASDVAQGRFELLELSPTAPLGCGRCEGWAELVDRDGTEGRGDFRSHQYSRNRSGRTAEE
jgi:hypothetical protein